MSQFFIIYLFTTYALIAIAFFSLALLLARIFIPAFITVMRKVSSPTPNSFLESSLPALTYFFSYASLTSLYFSAIFFITFVFVTFSGGYLLLYLGPHQKVLGLILGGGSGGVIIAVYFISFFFAASKWLFYDERMRRQAVDIFASFSLWSNFFALLAVSFLSIARGGGEGAAFASGFIFFVGVFGITITSSILALFIKQFIAHIAPDEDKTMPIFNPLIPLIIFIVSASALFSVLMLMHTQEIARDEMRDAKNLADRESEAAAIEEIRARNDLKIASIIAKNGKAEECFSALVLYEGYSDDYGLAQSEHRGETELCLNVLAAKTQNSSICEQHTRVYNKNNIKKEECQLLVKYGESSLAVWKELTPESGSFGGLLTGKLLYCEKIAPNFHVSPGYEKSRCIRRVQFLKQSE